MAIRPPGSHIGESTNHSHRLSAGAIAGIVIGAVAALVIAALLGITLWKRNRSKKHKKPEHMTVAPVEIDSKEPYPMSPSSLGKGHPQSPELDVVEHKGHELDSQSTYFAQSPVTDGQRYELAATERRSQTLSSPISLISEGSDPTRLHRREPSDPVSLVRERSDATRLHKRELSDPVSVLSERREEEGVGTL